MRGLAADSADCSRLPVNAGANEPISLPTGGAFSDAELVRRAGDGEAWAEEVLYRRYADLVLGTAKRLLGNRDEALDVAQDAFLAAFEKLPSLRDAATFKTWLMQIAIRQVHRRFRRRRLLGWLGMEGGPEDEAALEELVAADAPPDVRAEVAALYELLARLPASLRVPWVLRHVEGHELTEVAALCECSLATVKRRIAAAGERVAYRFGEGAAP